MTIVVDADVQKLEQVKHQLGRLIDIIEVQEFKENEIIDRELLLARVTATAKTKPELKRIAKQFGAKLAKSTDRSVVIEATGDTQELDRLVEHLRPHGITKLVRTGRVALET